MGIEEGNDVERGREPRHYSHELQSFKTALCCNVVAIISLNLLLVVPLLKNQTFRVCVRNVSLTKSCKLDHGRS